MDKTSNEAVNVASDSVKSFIFRKFPLAYFLKYPLLFFFFFKLYTFSNSLLAVKLLNAIMLLNYSTNISLKYIFIGKYSNI